MLRSTFAFVHKKPVKMLRWPATYNLFKWSHRYLMLTWGKASKVRLKFVFLLGYSPLLKTFIQMESNLYKDIIQETFLDDYRNNGNVRHNIGGYNHRSATNVGRPNIIRKFLFWNIPFWGNVAFNFCIRISYKRRFWMTIGTIQWKQSWVLIGFLQTVQVQNMSCL
jgi:hypothetical protein